MQDELLWRARDLGGAIVEESVVVMSALRLLQGAGATGALVGDFMAREDALDLYSFPAVHQEFRDATDCKEGIKDRHQLQFQWSVWMHGGGASRWQNVQ